MTCRGHVHNGTIVLDEPTKLPEGAEVEVQVREVGRRKKLRLDELERIAGGISYDFEAFETLREASKE